MRTDETAQMISIMISVLDSCPIGTTLCSVVFIVAKKNNHKKPELFIDYPVQYGYRHNQKTKRAKAKSTLWHFCDFNSPNLWKFEFPFTIISIYILWIIYASLHLIIIIVFLYTIVLKKKKTKLSEFVNQTKSISWRVYFPTLIMMEMDFLA